MIVVNDATLAQKKDTGDISFKRGGYYTNCHEISTSSHRYLSRGIGNEPDQQLHSTLWHF